MSTERATRKSRVGKVVSNKMTNTVVVSIDLTSRHPLYAKTMRKQRKVYAHDADNSCRIGDVVRIVEARPMSKLKRWRVAEVVEKGRE